MCNTVGWNSFVRREGDVGSYVLCLGDVRSTPGEADKLAPSDKGPARVSKVYLKASQEAAPLPHTQHIGPLHGVEDRIQNVCRKVQKELLTKSVTRCVTEAKTHNTF
eukprot:1698316-Amphidinium_carterae.1